MSTMRAARLHAWGEPLRVDEVPRPAPGPRDLLVEVSASSVNPVDVKIASGTHRVVIPWKLPWIQGLDVCGRVVETGAEVREFAVGDRIFASTDHRRPGCFAEYVLVDAAVAAPKPESLTPEQAAAVPLTALTAWQSLVDAADLQAGERVLIQAGAGGVGSMAVPLAKHLGAHVLSTCGPRNTEHLRALGADEVIDYTEQRFEEVARDCDVVLESVGGDARARALRCLKPGGRHVSITSDLPLLVKRYGPLLGTAAVPLRLAAFALRARLGSGVRAHNVLQRPNGAQLARIGALIDRGIISPVTEAVYPLEAINEAFGRVAEGHTRGKVIVRPA